MKARVLNLTRTSLTKICFYVFNKIFLFHKKVAVKFRLLLEAQKKGDEFGKMKTSPHRWMEMTPKMSTWRRLLINFRFTILHRKSFPCSYFFFGVEHAFTSFHLCERQGNTSQRCCIPSLAINDKLLPRCFASLRGKA